MIHLYLIPALFVAVCIVLILLPGGYKLLDDSSGRHEMNTFVATQTSTGLWRLAAEGEGHDDTVIARALANQPELWAIII